MTTKDMDYLEQSQEIVPLVFIQAWPLGWMPTITQELKRYGDPRHETHSSWMADNNSTQRMRSKPYSRWDCSRRTGGRRSDEVDPSTYEIPIMGSKSKFIFAIHPFFDQFINNYPQVQPLVRWRVPVLSQCRHQPYCGRLPVQVPHQHLHPSQRLQLPHQHLHPNRRLRLRHRRRQYTRSLLQDSEVHKNVRKIFFDCMEIRDNIPLQILSKWKTVWILKKIVLSTELEYGWVFADPVQVEDSFDTKKK